MAYRVAIVDDSEDSLEAVEHGLASPDTADKTYRRALEKMCREYTESTV